MRAAWIAWALFGAACASSAPPAPAPVVISLDHVRGTKVARIEDGAAGASRCAHIRPRLGGYRDELRRMMTDDEGGSGTAAAKALALLGEDVGLAHLRSAVASDPHDSFALAALVLTGDESARARALGMIDAVDDATFVMLAYGFAERPDPTVLARLRTLAQVDDDAGMQANYARVLLAQLGEGYEAEVAALLERGPQSYEAVFAAAAMLGREPGRAQALLEEVLRDPTTNFLDSAGMAFGEHPKQAPPDLLEKAIGNAVQPHDRVWLRFGLLSACR